LGFLETNNLLKLNCSHVNPTLIERFLETFKTSATYYMTKRSSLAGIFTRMVRSGMIEANPVWKTSRKKPVAVLNKAFTKVEMVKVLEYLQEAHNGLYLCGLLMYGCFLRPHREVRCLKVKHISKNGTTITLSGSENKGKRIRIIPVPPYIQQILLTRMAGLPDADCHIISGTEFGFNPDYFKTAWGRLKHDMAENGLLVEAQSLYSFRHSGAVELYLKTKDPYKVQLAMGHSSLMVTLGYLRSLGITTRSACEYPEL
jgi:integrase